MTCVADLPLHGAGGEPVDFARTIVSHGVAELPPNRVELAARIFETTLPMPRDARTVRITASGKHLHVEAVEGTVGAQARTALTQTVAHIFRLDEDLSRFYTLVGEDGDLSWCVAGAGRMLRSPTVFEDVVKTICAVIQTPRSIFTVASGKGGLGTFAPRLDFAGNGVRGQLAAARPSRRLGLDLFVSQAEGRVH